MPIEPTTIFFEDYFDGDDPLDSYGVEEADRLSEWSDMYEEVRRYGGPSDEGFLRCHAPTYNCPNCVDWPPDCGTPDAACYFAQNFIRKTNGTSTIGAWRHFRIWVRPHFGAGWNQDYDGGVIAGILYDEPYWVITSYPDFPYEALALSYDYGNARWEYGVEMMGGSYALPVLWDEWTCFELATSLSSAPVGFFMHSKAWVNDALVVDGVWDFTGSGYSEGLSPIRGFTFGNWGGQIAGAGKWIDFARVSWADGPIGCGSRGDLPPDSNPVDPDAMRCIAADNYAGAVDGGLNELKGDCGRAICNTTGKTREDWETFDTGFLSTKSFWYGWTAPRSGRYIFRTRGSEIYNEVGVYRHTGSFPPPLVGFSDEDPWDPDATTSSAVEVAVEQGVEYRIRVASSSDGWTVLDFGPAYPIIQDDGWTINDSERATRVRASAAGTVSGLAVEDDQVAAAANGAGAERTLDGVLWGAV